MFRDPKVPRFKGRSGCPHFGGGVTTLHLGRQGISCLGGKGAPYVGREEQQSLLCDAGNPTFGGISVPSIQREGSQTLILKQGSFIWGKESNPQFRWREPQSLGNDLEASIKDRVRVWTSSPQLVWGPHPLLSVSRNSWAQPGLYCWEAGDSTPPCGHSWTPARPLRPSHLGRDPVMRAGMETPGSRIWRWCPSPTGLTTSSGWTPCPIP